MSGGENRGAPQEQETFLETKRPRPADKGRLRNFFEFLYNRQTGRVLGRTGISWLEITVFYIIFYSCLIGFWAICLAVFVQTLDPHVPTWYGKGTIIGVNPGYANKTKTRQCTGDQSNRDNTDDSCRVDPDVDFPGCTKGNDYGYKEGQPCVAISINRLIAWEPVAYPENSAPEPVKPYYDPKYIAISCEGEYYSDHENIGEVKYLPEKGLAFKYYPYKVMPNYHQPIVMAKFVKPPIGVLVEVECKAYAYNVIHDTGDRQGMVHFELLVDS